MDDKNNNVASASRLKTRRSEEYYRNEHYRREYRGRRARNRDRSYGRERRWGESSSGGGGGGGGGGYDWRDHGRERERGEGRRRFSGGGCSRRENGRVNGIRMEEDYQEEWGRRRTFWACKTPRSPSPGPRGSSPSDGKRAPSPPLTNGITVSKPHFESSSEAGYHSSGFLSDGQEASSRRSVGSVGSLTDSRPVQPREEVNFEESGSIASAGGASSVGTVPTMALPGESRFPHASYAASEAAKSDIATVCSGSVVEDIDVASVMSGDLNATGSTGGVMTMSERMARKSAPLTSPAATWDNKLGCGSIVVGSGGVTLGGIHPPIQDAPPIMLNDMGPPLSRMLMGSSSQAGSVQSSSGDVPSDVVAHVDTDDGGSIAAEIAEIDVHSVHSAYSREEPNPPAEKPPSTSNPDDRPEEPSPLAPRSALSSGSGRTSPGGTVYKGRGVRRYQGRYMHLPLKRFHQNGGGGTEEVSVQFMERGRSTSPRRSWSRSRSRSRSGSNPRSWSRSRSRSRSPARDRSNSRSPPRYRARSSRSSTPSPRRMEDRRSNTPSPIRHHKTRSRSASLSPRNGIYRRDRGGRRSPSPRNHSPRCRTTHSRSTSIS